MRTLLVKLVFGIWSALHPRAPQQGDARAIAEAMVGAVLADAANPPVFGSHVEDLAVGALYADLESAVRLRPGHWVDPKTGKAVDPLAQGPWQTHRLPEGASPSEYARDWLRQLRDGAKACPRSPAAPLSGGCDRAVGLANRRVGQARRALVAALASLGGEAVASADQAARDGADQR